MATFSSVSKPGYVWSSTDNVWYPIGVGTHTHSDLSDSINYNQIMTIMGAY